MSDSISRLTNTLSLRFTQHSSPNRSISPNIPLTQRQSARRHYEQFTNCSKEEMKRLVKMDQTMRRANWRHDHIKANNTFSVFEKKGLDHFPHNNDKYNVQFLQRSLYGKNYASPAKKIGCFQPPKDRLYSHHYRPIVRSKRSYNQDYQLRTSIFGQTWVDSKRDKILDEYKTPVSNALISTMRQDRRHYHKL